MNEHDDEVLFLIIEIRAVDTWTQMGFDSSPEGTAAGTSDIQSAVLLNSMSIREAKSCKINLKFFRFHKGLPALPRLDQSLI